MQPLHVQPPAHPTASSTDIVPEAVALFPLSLMQESLWFMAQVAPQSSAYNVPEARALKGQLDIPTLHASLDALSYRHESLRTVFTSVEGNPMQAVLRPRGFLLELRDVSGEKPNADDLHRLLETEAVRPFDLENGPLARATLFRLGSEDHVLLVTLHHIICDQWSLNLFFSELACNYRVIRAGGSPAKAELPIQYGDFAVWQRETLKDQLLQELLQYWREKLQGPLPRLSLSTDFRRPSLASFRGRTQFFTLPHDLSRALKQLSRSQGVTSFMTLVAALKVFLHRYCRQTDIIVGSPMTRRDPIETQRMIGHFVNTHALRTDLAGNPSFSELLHRVRETVLGADSHQGVSIDQVVRQLEIERGATSQSLFEVVCGLQPSATLETYGAELVADRIEVDNRGAKFDWTLLFTESSRGLELRCEYSTDLFEASTITRWIRHFETLLNGIIAHPERRLAEFPLVTEAERVRLLTQPQNTTTDPVATCIHERFEKQAAESPQATAVSFGQDTLSYSELNARANQLARHLQRWNVGPEVPVALCLERSLQMIVAVLGVLKAGGAYVPVDPACPKERLRFILEDTGARIILTEEKLRETVDPTGAKTIFLDSDWPQISSEPAENLPPRANPENAAYIIYTSGSTGKPKGVIVPHLNVIRLFAHTAQWFEFNSSDVWSLFHSYTFDFSVWEIWGALLYGGRLVIVPYRITRSPAEFYGLLAQEKVTILNQTPSAFQQLIWAEQQAPKPLPLSLRSIIFGGEALDLQSLRSWFETHGDQQPRLVNMYGITETTVHVTYRVIEQADLAKGTVSPIGIPIPDLQLYLLDETLQPVPPGVPGEIFVGGAGVARGYLNRPELTRERFIGDPFSGRPGARLYRTGDLARFTSRGQLEYLGRLDDQVKIRGFRIETGEIESILNAHPTVRRALVVLRTEASAGPQLVAYIVPAEVSCSSKELRRYLSTIVPEYMVPAHFVLLDQLPLTVNGKVDRRALPSPQLEPAPARTAPRNPTETLIANIWSQLIGCGSVDIHDNFFHLGGHSLLATQVMSRLASALGCDVSVGLIFEFPTIATLAEAITRIQREEPAASGPIPRRQRSQAKPNPADSDSLTSVNTGELLRASQSHVLSA